MEAAGAYKAERAAALSGVPRSTIYNWARTGILVPSVSPEKVQLWSYTDLMALRVVYWLRQPKRGDSGYDIPATSMPSVRRALDELRRLKLPLWSPDRSIVVVSRDGHVHIDTGDILQDDRGQFALRDCLDVTAPFETLEGSRGPDLVRPRPALRILPGKLAGSPHIEDTRVETIALGALRDGGLSRAAIQSLYPYLTPEQVADAVDLEDQLNRNLQPAA